MVNQFETLSGAIEGAIEHGYKCPFRISGNNAFCPNHNKNYKSEDMLIVEYHRFEGVSDPEDMEVLYLVKCNDGHKGFIVDAYGVYSSKEVDDFIQNVKVLEGI